MMMGEDEEDDVGGQSEGQMIARVGDFCGRI